MRANMKIRLLFLGLVAQEAFAPAAALAANRDSSAGAIPQSFQKNEVRASDLQDPGIISADDPGAPCVVNATGQDHSRARIAGVRIGDKCLPQQDAFKRAATALTAAQEALSAAEDEWLTLELLREEIEGG